LATDEIYAFTRKFGQHRFTIKKAIRAERQPAQVQARKQFFRLIPDITKGWLFLFTPKTG
jgi:hypothetical protein